MTENACKNTVRTNIIAKSKKSLGRQCAAFGCTNTFYNEDGTRSEFHFFTFPQKGPRKTRWCNLIKRHDGMDGFQVTANTALCHIHFKEDDYRRNLNSWRLRNQAEPSLNLYNSFEKKTSFRPPPIDRSFNLSDTSIGLSSLMISSPEPLPLMEFFLLDDDYCPENFRSTFVSVEVQTDFSFVHMPVYFPNVSEELLAHDHSYSCQLFSSDEVANICLSFDHLDKKVKEQSDQISSLKAQLSQCKQELKNILEKQFSIHKMKDDDNAIKFYTGFPNYSSLVAIYEYFEPKFARVHYWEGPKSKGKKSLTYQQVNSAKPGRKRTLPLIDEFILVLMRLKVGLFIEDLAVRFHISPGHVSKIFTTWINYLYHELPLLFPFPSQALVRKFMPKQFSSYPTTRVIIDCTEIFIEIPSSMKSQSQTWSQYKHHNTWKSLVAISPTGCITFVSKLWSGRVTDKKITKDCGILQLLDSGDNVMADRGFDIQDILPKGVALNIPPFKGHRDQLTAEEAEETAKIASVRIHVERAIGRVKNYHLLDGVLPLSVTPVANQIFTVCCYLTNFLPPLVPPPPTQG